MLVWNYNAQAIGLQFLLSSVAIYVDSRVR